MAWNRRDRVCGASDRERRGDREAVWRSVSPHCLKIAAATPRRLIPSALHTAASVGRESALVDADVSVQAGFARALARNTGHRGTKQAPNREFAWRSRREAIGADLDCRRGPLPWRHSSEVAHPGVSVHAGPFTRAQALAAGYTPSRIRRLLADGAWVVMRHGIYVPRSTVTALAGDPRRRHALEVAAVLLALGRDAVGAGSSAAWILGLDVLDEPTDLVVLVNGKTMRGTRRDDYVIRRATLPPAHRTGATAYR